jgi:hypothetical protein
MSLHNMFRAKLQSSELDYANNDFKTKLLGTKGS